MTMKDDGSDSSPMQEAMMEAQRLSSVTRKCHETAVRTLARGEAEPDEARALRLFCATERLIAARDIYMQDARDVLLLAGRALRDGGG
jgi:hypothetical protein